MLQSILMALEEWLLNQCENPDSHQSLIYAIKLLLSSSKSVATTGVLSSVFVAHPETLGNLSLPILKVKEFYFYDLQRCANDKIKPIDFGYHVNFIDVLKAGEEKKSHEFPQRKKHLENLAFELQFGALKNEVFQIIDKFNRECDSVDMQWKLVLNRIDFRKREVGIRGVKDGKEYVELIPKLDKDVKVHIEEFQKETASANVGISIFATSVDAYKKENKFNSNIDTWKTLYEEFQKMSKQNNLGHYFSEKGVIYLAAWGFRDFYSNLKEEERNWCVDYLLNALEQRIKTNNNPQDFLKGAITIEPTLELIPDILTKNLSVAISKKAKDLLFKSLLFFDHQDLNTAIITFRNHIWAIDSNYANACFMGLIEYGRLRVRPERFDRYYIDKEVEREMEEWKAQNEIQRTAIPNDVISNTIDIDTTKVSFKSHMGWYLIRAVQLMPFDTKDQIQIDYIKTVTTLLLNKKIDRNKGTSNFELDQAFCHYLSYFLYFQPLEVSKEHFQNIIESPIQQEENLPLRDLKNFISEILRNLIRVEDQNQLGRLWDLWSIWAEQMRQTKKTFLVSYLFLDNISWKEGSKSWIPFINQEIFFEGLVNDFGYLAISSITRLLATIGADHFLPHGLIWLEKSFRRKSNILKYLNEGKTMKDLEKIVQIIYYQHKKSIRKNSSEKDALLFLLEEMIKNGSTLAFITRERIIAV